MYIIIFFYKSPSIQYSNTVKQITFKSKFRQVLSVRKVILISSNQKCSKDIDTKVNLDHQISYLHCFFKCQSLENLAVIQIELLEPPCLLFMFALQIIYHDKAHMNMYRKEVKGRLLIQGSQVRLMLSLKYWRMFLIIRH